MRTFPRYVLFQLPGWVLAIVVAVALWHWAGLDPWFAAGLGALWVLKDFVLYPLVRGAYERKVGTGSDSLIGMTGVVQRRLAPRGLVRVRNELWRAEIPCGEPAVESGEPVRIRGARGLTLLVSREGDHEPHTR